MTDWEAQWQHHNTGWDRGETSPALARWLALRRIGQRVLVPGAGSGYEVVSLASAGFDVTAIDLAPTALSRLAGLLETAGVQAHLVEADMLAWHADHPFDTIYEQTSLCALPPEHWPRYVRQLHRWLKPRGELLAQFMQTGQPGGPPFDCPIDRMRSLFAERNWRWLDGTMTHVEHPSGRYEVSVALIRRAPREGESQL